MPPKKNKGGGGGGAKPDKAKKVQDLTFGMKNKKGGRAQKMIQQMKKQNQGSTKEDMKRQREIEEQKKLKEMKKKEKEMMNDLFKPVIIQQKVPFGVDPKSIVCEFHKKGQCEKGRKCKFSHDLNQGRKVEKRDLYTDSRQAEEEEEKRNDTMDKWDQSKLEEVVNKKRGENKNAPTKIVCKHFLKAVEEHKYGWFWECPNGGKKCQYVHALPPGYVLKKPKTKDGDEEEEKGPSLEELIEVERSKITGGTPVTLETFTAWKERVKKEKDARDEKNQKERQAAIKSGKSKMTGREAFVFQPDLFVDDEGADDSANRYKGRDSDNEEDGDDDNNDGDDGDNDHQNGSQQPQQPASNSKGGGESGDSSSKQGGAGQSGAGSDSAPSATLDNNPPDKDAGIASDSNAAKNNSTKSTATTTSTSSKGGTAGGGAEPPAETIIQNVGAFADDENLDDLDDFSDED